MKTLRTLLITMLSVVIILSSGTFALAAEVQPVTEPEQEEIIADIFDLPEDDPESLDPVDRAALGAENETAAAEDVICLSDDPGESIEFPADPLPVPAIPAMNACKPYAAGITISWKEVSDAESYNVYMYGEKSKKWVKIYSGAETSFSYEPITIGKVYLFSAEAVNGEVSSGFDTVGTPGVYLNQPTPTVKRSGSSAVLKWNKIKNADGYKVYRQLTDGKNKQIADVTTNKYVDSSVKQDKTYTYSVKAYKKYNGKVYDGWYDAAENVTFLYFSAPTLKKTTNTEEGVQLTWAKTTGAAKYYVYRKKTGESWKQIHVTKSRSYLDTTARNGVVYRYTVAAMDKTGIRGDINTTGIKGCFVPSTQVTGLENDVAGVTITWDKAGAATGYKIFRKNAEGDRIDLAKVGAVTSFTDTSAKSGEHYRYYVRAFRVTGGKTYPAYLNENGSKSILRLEAPVLSKTDGSDGVTITWKAVNGAAGYRVYRKQGTSGAWTKIGSGTATTYQDKTAVQGTVYRYSVSAVNGSTVSAYRDNGIAGVWLETPTLNSLTATLDGLHLKWSGVKGANRYRIMRKDSAGKWVVVKTTSSTAYMDKDVQENQSYTYTVRPLYKSGSNNCYGKYDTKGIKAAYVDVVKLAIEDCLDQSGWNLKEAFNWVINLNNIKYTNLQPDADSTRIYAKWCLDRFKGNSFGKSAVFCLMARELGYEAYLVSGYMTNSAGNTIKHGWVEIYDGGKLYVCDLAYANEGKESFFKRQYGRPGVPKYKDYHRVPIS